MNLCQIHGYQGGQQCPQCFSAQEKFMGIPNHQIPLLQMQQYQPMVIYALKTMTEAEFIAIVEKEVAKAMKQWVARIGATTP